MKVRYKWFVLVTAAVSPLLCNAGLIRGDIDSTSEQGFPAGLHSLGLKIGGDKDDSKDNPGLLPDNDRPGHSYDFGNHDNDRGSKGSNGYYEQHDPTTDRPRHHRPPWNDGPVTHLGDHDGTVAVPDSASTAMLLGATFLGLAAFARTSQPAGALSKLRSRR